MSAGYFELKKSTSGQYHFNLKAGNHEIILSSQLYASKESAKNGIESVQKNCVDDESYERKKSSSNQDYFVLKAKNQQIIGRSEIYSSHSAMENGIASVKTNGSSDTVKDLEVMA